MAAVVSLRSCGKSWAENWPRNGEDWIALALSKLSGRRMSSAEEFDNNQADFGWDLLATFRPPNAKVRQHS